MKKLRRRDGESVIAALEREQRRHSDAAARLRSRADARAAAANEQVRQLVAAAREDVAQFERQAVRADREAEVCRRQAAAIAEADKLTLQAAEHDAAAEAAGDRHAVLADDARELGAQLEAAECELGQGRAQVEQLTDDGQLDEAAALERELAGRREQVDLLVERLGRLRDEAEQVRLDADTKEAGAVSLRERATSLRADARAAREAVDSEVHAEQKRRADELERWKRQPLPPEPADPTLIEALGDGWFYNKKNGMRFRL
jgi:hypothetical protein